MQNLSDERYFIVFFNYERDGDVYYGNSGYSNSGYVNNKETIDFIKKITGVEHVSITNIIELNKKDYDCYFE